MVPTVLEALGIEPPASIRGGTQSPLEGLSFAPTLADAGAEGRHHTQYFEMFGHRAIYHDGWRAVCPWPGSSFKEGGQIFGAEISAEKLIDLDFHGWELYHVAEDFAENHNLAAENRAKLIEMISLWYIEAGKYKVLPIDSRGTLRYMDERPAIAPSRLHYTYYPDTQKIPDQQAANMLNRSHSITADVDIPAGGAEGVLLSQGSDEGGYVLYVKDDRLHYVHNYVAKKLYHVESREPVPEGRHKLRYEFEVTGKPDLPGGKGSPGRGQLYIDDRLVGQADIPVTIPIRMTMGGGIVVGADPGAAVTHDYEPPFRFTGKIYRVDVDLSGELIKDADAEMRIVMAQQ
jgi:arylsulfatase